MSRRRRRVEDVMSPRARWGMLVGGGLSFGLGSAATFATSNEAGTAALITVGALALAVGARGAWPLSVGADGIDWEAQAHHAAGQVSQAVQAAAAAPSARRSRTARGEAESAVDTAAGTTVPPALLAIGNLGAATGFSAARAGAARPPQMVDGQDGAVTWSGLSQEN